MTLALPLKGDRARYDITVVSHENTLSGKEPKRFSRKGYSRVKNIGAKVSAAFLALMVGGLMLLGTIGAAPVAKAGDLLGVRDAFCGMAYFNAMPEDRGLGPNTANPALINQNAKLTAYEKYGMAGMTWTVWLGAKDHGQLDGKGDVAGKQLVNMGGGEGSLNDWGKGPGNKTEKDYPSFYNTTDECTPLTDVGTTAIGNFLLSVTSWIVNISNLLFQTATETSSDVLQTLTPTITTIVTQLKDTLYLEFLGPVIMVGALVMGWRGLVKRSSTEAGTSAVWMFGATVAGLALLANPMFISSVANTVVSTVTESTIASITKVALAGNGASGVATANATLCTVDGRNGSTQTVDGNGKTTTVDFSSPDNASKNSARTSIRQIQCTMWYSFMYTPWVIGEYGVSPSATDNKILAENYPNQTGDIAPLVAIPKDISLGGGSTPGNWPIYQLDNKVNYPGSNSTAQQKAMLNVAASQMYKGSPNTTWKGNSSMNRVTTATLAMLSALGAGAMIGIISMSMIVLQIGLIILTLLAPLFFLIGVHPGFGRRIALGWLESIAGIAMKRIVLSVLLSIMLVFYSAVLSASATTDWLVSMIMVIAVSIGGITYKDKLTAMFSRINFGGNGGLSEEDMGGAHLSRAGSAVRSGAKGLAGTAMAFGAGAFSGSNKALAHNKALQQKAREDIAARRKNGEDPSAGAGGRPNRDGPTVVPDVDDASPVDTSGAGGRPQDAEDAAQIDGQGELFPEADVRPKPAEVPDPRLAGDIAAGQDRVNAERRRLSERAGINGHRPASEGDGRRAMLAAAQEEALRENARYNRFKKAEAIKAKFDNKIDSAKGSVQRTVDLVGDKKAKAVNAVTRSVAKSTPVRAANAARDASRARIERAKEAANSYHALAKSNSPRYNKAVQRHNEKKVVKQERRADNKEVRQIVANHAERKSVRSEAMKHAVARAKARNRNNELAKMVRKTKGK